MRLLKVAPKYVPRLLIVVDRAKRLGAVLPRVRRTDVCDQLMQFAAPAFEPGAVLTCARVPATSAVVLLFSACSEARGTRWCLRDYAERPWRKGPVFVAAWETGPPAVIQWFGMRPLCLSGEVVSIQRRKVRIRTYFGESSSRIKNVAACAGF